MCISFFSTTSVQNILLSDKYLARYAETHVGLHVKSSPNLSDLNENLYGFTVFCKTLKYI
jgi:hypothetical protein